jgi:hypothetical protein
MAEGVAVMVLPHVGTTEATAVGAGLPVPQLEAR